MKKWLVLLPLAFVAFSLFAKENSKEEAPKYKDGVYKGSAKGYSGEIKVAVKVKEGKISKIKVLKHKESDPDTSLKKIPERIIKEQKTQVDAVTGATITSKALMKAVDNALSKAKQKKTN